MLVCFGKLAVVSAAVLISTASIIWGVGAQEVVLDERFIRAGAEDVQFQLNGRPLDEAFFLEGSCIIDDVGVWNPDFLAVSAANFSARTNETIDTIDEVDCCLWCHTQTERGVCNSFVWRESTCYLYSFAVTRNNASVQCNECVVGARESVDRPAPKMDDSQLFRNSESFATTFTEASGNFLGNADSPDFLRRFTVAEDTHVKLTTCLEVYPGPEIGIPELSLLDTYIGVYRVRDEDDRLVFVAENDDCDLCTLRTTTGRGAVADPTQSMVDVVLESGTYLLHIEGGAGADAGDNSGSFRYAILEAEPAPQPEWQLETCELPDPRGRKLPFLTSGNTTDSLALYFNFTASADYQVLLTTCVNVGTRSQIDPVIRVFDHAPLAEAGMTLSPGDELDFNVRFDRLTQDDPLGACIALDDDFHEAYIEFDLPADTPRYVMVDGLDGTSGLVAVSFQCSEGIPTPVPTLAPPTPPATPTWTAVITGVPVPVPTPVLGSGSNISELSATSGSGLSASATASVVIGSVVGLVAVCTLLYRLRRKRDAPPPPAEAPSVEAQMESLRPHDDPPPYDEDVEADAPPLPHAEDEREDLMDEEVALTVSVDKGSNHAPFVDLDPDAPSDSESEADFRVPRDSAWNKENKRDTGDEKRNFADVKNDGESLVIIVDTNGEGQERRRSQSQSESKSSSERSASSPSASSVDGGGDGEDGVLEKSSLELGADAESDTRTTPMTKETKRRGSMEGIPEPECVVSSLQVRNSVYTSEEAGEADIDPQGHSRRKEASAAKQLLPISDVVDGEIEWETESETELEEDARDALWDPDGVDGWSDISEPDIVFEQGARAPGGGAGDEPDQQPPPARPILRDGKLVGAPRRVKECDECGLSIRGVKNFADHMKQAHGKKAGYACGVCGRVMRRRFNLKVHMRTHLGQHAHEFACKLCGESFVQRSNLKRHMLTNHEKPVKCPCCKARFVTKEAAHAHTVEAHPDAQKKKVRVRRIPERKPAFSCPCKQTFPTLEDLLRHSERDCESSVKVKIDGEALIIPRVATSGPLVEGGVTGTSPPPSGNSAASALSPSSGNSAAGALSPSSGNSAEASRSSSVETAGAHQHRRHHQERPSSSHQHPSSFNQHPSSSLNHTLSLHKHTTSSLYPHPLSSHQHLRHPVESLSSSRSPSADEFEEHYHRPGNTVNNPQRSPNSQVHPSAHHVGPLSQRVEGEGFPSASAFFSGQEGAPNSSHVSLSALQQHMFPNAHAASSGDVLGQQTLPNSMFGAFPHVHPGNVPPYTSSVTSALGHYLSSSAQADMLRASFPQAGPGSPVSPHATEYHQGMAHAHSPVGSNLQSEVKLQENPLFPQLAPQAGGIGTAAPSLEQIARVLARLEQKTSAAAATSTDGAPPPSRPFFSQQDHQFLADLKRLVYGGGSAASASAAGAAAVNAVAASTAAVGAYSTQAQTHPATPLGHAVPSQVHTSSGMPDTHASSSPLSTPHASVSAIESMSVGASQSGLAFNSPPHTHVDNMESSTYLPPLDGGSHASTMALDPHQAHEASHFLEIQSAGSLAPQPPVLAIPPDDLVAPYSHSSGISSGLAPEVLSGVQPPDFTNHASLLAQDHNLSAPALVGDMSHPYAPSPLVTPTNAARAEAHRRNSFSLTSASLAPAGTSMAAPLHRSGSLSAFKAEHAPSRRESLSLTSASLPPAGMTAPSQSSDDRGSATVDSSSNGENSVGRRPTIGVLPDQDHLTHDAFDNDLDHF